MDNRLPDTVIVLSVLFTAMLIGMPHVCRAQGARKTVNIELFKTIKEDHAEIMKLFEKMEKADVTERGMYTLKIKKKILPHMQAEDMVFYKSLQEKHDAQYDAVKAIQEHKTVRKLLDEVAVAPEADYPAKFAELKRAVQEHIKFEEGQIFILAEKEFNPGELEGINKRFMQEKQRIKLPVYLP